MPELSRASQYLIVDCITLLVECSVYFVSLAGPIWLATSLEVSPAWYPLMAVGGWLWAATCFVLCLVGLRRALGKVPTGRFLLQSPQLYPWFAADRLVKIMVRSPFKPLVDSHAMFRLKFYRGMGASIHSDLITGAGVVLPEPWALTIGKRVVLGDGVVLAGHKVERNTVTLGEIEIADDVLVGAFSIIFPGVTIGKGAVIGANSVVSRGTIIPAGAIWSGPTARPIDLFEQRRKRRDSAA